MGFSTPAKAKHRASPQMNVTPLVDVVLVLLIIFMVVTPLLSKQLWLQLPKNDDSAEPPSSENKSVVLSVNEDGTVAINGAAVPEAELRDKIARVMAARSDKVLYFEAADQAPYAATVRAMDVARQGGAKSIAILTKNVTH